MCKIIPVYSLKLKKSKISQYYSVEYNIRHNVNDNVIEFRNVRIRLQA